MEELKDHDLLIRVDAKLELLIKVVAELNSNVNNRINVVETKVAILDKEKLDIMEGIRLLGESVKEQEDHEKRIRILERWVWTAIGALAVLQIVFSVVIKI